MPQKKYGIVSIVDLFEDGMTESGPRFEGHWDSGSEPHRMLENGPGWDDAEEAIRWGREPASKVFIRIGTQIYSAGEEDPRDEPVVRWESR